MAHFRLLISFMLAALGTVVPSHVSAQTATRCFVDIPGVTNCIEGRFLQYWEQNGGLPVFGYPITPAQQELNVDTGQTYLTQWFERNRFELHLENSPPYDVLLGRLGDAALRRAGRDWQREPREPGPQPGCLWFPDTGHNLCDALPGSEGFAGIGNLTYWQTHGVDLDGDPQRVTYGESLALFGQPLTDERLEMNGNGDTVPTQWFERARFEWHGQRIQVLLGLLGNEVHGGPAPASPVNDSFAITLEPRSGSPGTSVTIVGQGAPAHSQVAVVWAPLPQDQACVQQPGTESTVVVQADVGGRFTWTHQPDRHGANIAGVVYYAKYTEGTRTQPVCFMFD